MIKRNFIKKSLRLRVKSTHQILDGIPKKINILDIGCGSGEVISSIALKYKLDAEGLDIAKNAIETCRRKYSIPNLLFMEGDIRNLPYDDNSFDVVLTLSLIEWIDDYKKAIAEVSRVLKNGGSWVVSIPNWQSPFRKFQRFLSRFQKTSYLHSQKNRVGAMKFIELAESIGFTEKYTGYQILPFLPINLKNSLIKRFGMMCMIVLTKD
jgi:ubiquinone/menaquinone biosynthesis C-methylase UbiE